MIAMLAENLSRSSGIHRAWYDSGDGVVTILCNALLLLISYLSLRIQDKDMIVIYLSMALSYYSSASCRHGAEIRTQPSPRLNSYNRPGPGPTGLAIIFPYETAL